MKEVLHSNIQNHIVCVTNAIVNLDERTEENQVYWKEYLKSNRHKFYKNIDMKKRIITHLLPECINYWLIRN